MGGVFKNESDDPLVGFGPVKSQPSASDLQAANAAKAANRESITAFSRFVESLQTRQPVERRRPAPARGRDKSSLAFFRRGR